MARLRAALPVPRRHVYESVLRRRDSARGLMLLLGIIAVGLTILLANQRIETIRRTGTAPIHVVTTELQPGSRYEQSPTGKWITYYYVVDGAAYPGRDFRRWLNVAAHEPKVCFDPANPTDHLLVEGRVTCGD